MTRHFADLVRARRRARGLKVEDLAAQVDCDASTVRRWERGDALPGPRHMPALRTALAIPLDVLEEACGPDTSPGRSILRVEGVAHMSRTGKDWTRLLDEIGALEARTLDITDPRDACPAAKWVPIYRMIPGAWRVLSDGDAIVGVWLLVPLTGEAFDRFVAGRCRHSEITPAEVEPPSFPGLYDAYLASFALDASYRYGAPFQMLFDSLAEQLERYAAAGIFFRTIASPGFTPEGRRLCERLGFDRGALYADDPEKPIYSTPVRALVARPEFDRFQALRRLYDGE